METYRSSKGIRQALEWWKLNSKQWLDCEEEDALQYRYKEYTIHFVCDALLFKLDGNPMCTCSIFLYILYALNILLKTSAPAVYWYIQGDSWHLPGSLCFAHQYGHKSMPGRGHDCQNAWHSHIQSYSLPIAQTPWHSWTSRTKALTQRQVPEEPDIILYENPDECKNLWGENKPFHNLPCGVCAQTTLRSLTA